MYRVWFSALGVPLCMGMMTLLVSALGYSYAVDDPFFRARPVLVQGTILMTISITGLALSVGAQRREKRALSKIVFGGLVALGVVLGGSGAYAWLAGRTPPRVRIPEEARLDCLPRVFPDGPGATPDADPRMRACVKQAIACREQVFQDVENYLDYKERSEVCLTRALFGMPSSRPAPLP